MPKRAPIRSCVVCRTEKPQVELLRLVRGEDGRYQPDLSGRLHGRGAYLCGDEACMQQLHREKVFRRAFGFTADEAERDSYIQELTRIFRNRGRERARRLLGLARRQGALACGADAVARLLESWPLDQTICLFLAADAGEVAKRRFRRLADGQAARKEHFFFADGALSLSELGRVSGRERQAVALVTEAHLAAELGRLCLKCV